MSTTDTEHPMRTAGQVRQQLKQVLFRHLQRWLRANYKKASETCAFNRMEVVGDTGIRVGVCRWDSSQSKEELRTSPRGKLCDNRVFGCPAMSSACSWWKPLKTKEEIKESFRALISSGNRGHIAASFPDVAALMWVLDGEDVQIALTEATVEADPVPLTPEAPIVPMPEIPNHE